MKTLQLVILSSLFFLSFSCFSQLNPQNIVLSNPDNGNKVYVAGQEIRMLPGYSYSDNSASLHAYIQPNTQYQSLFSEAQFNQNVINTGLHVGSISGDYFVSESGAGGYDIPIQLPMGTNQMSLDFSVNYNNQQGDGLLGMGWNLQGLSAITLVPATFYHDNETENVELDGLDRFALDGRRLFSKTGTYGQNAATYSTEIESFVKITSYGSSGTPDWFKVETKEGLTLEYGRTSNSKIVSGSSAVVWHLNKVYDTNGNYASFDYSEQSGQHRIERILYTGNDLAGLTPYNEIKFKYGTRQDQNSYFIVGKEIRSKYVLSEIEIFSESTHYKTYKFDYGLNLHSYLKTITEFGANHEQLNSTIVKYGDSGLSSEFLPVSNFVGMSADFQSSGDFNGDGKSDLLVNHYYYDSGGNKIYTIWEAFVSNGANSFSHYAQGAIPSGYYMFFDHRKDDIKLSGLSTGLDFWGDGADDILLVKVSSSSSGTTLNSIQIVDINGLDNTSTYTPTIATGGYINSGKFLQVGDFDGDGRDDIFIMRYGSSGNLTYYGKLLTVQGGEQNVLMQGLAYLNAASQIHPSDFDGDGKKELMVLYDNSCEIFEFESQPQSGIYHIQKIYHSASPGFPTRWHKIIPGDFNGDGKTDILTTGDNVQWYVAYSNGVSFQNKSFLFTTTPNLSSSSQTIKVGDYNGDGKSDIVHAFSVFNGGVANTSQLDVYYSNGMSFVNESHTVGLITSYNDFGVGDFNGDGKNEIFNRDHYQYPANIMYFHRDAKDAFAEKIKDGFSRTVKFSYSWLTQTTNYTNGSTEAFPVLDRKNSLPIVTSVQKPNGINGQSTTNYYYKGAKWHRQGLGLMGFETTRNENYTTGVETISNYGVFADPFIPGLRLMLHNSSEKRMIATNQLVSKADYEYSVTSLSGIHVRVFETIVEERDYLKDIVKSTGFGYDVNGNMVTKFQSVGTETSFTNNEFGTFGSWWIPSVITNSTVTISRTGETPYVRKKIYSYSTKGAIIEEVMDYGTPKALTKKYSYDAFGNIKKTELSSPGEASITTKSNYDPLGRFVVSKINPLNQETIIENSKLWGKPIKITEVDGNETFFEYDGFGDITSSTDSRGAQTEYINIWNITTSNVSTEPNNTIYFTQTTKNNSATKKIWYDVLNREVKKMAQSLDNDIYVIKKYDAVGNIKSTTRPFFAGESPIATVYTYDEFQRPVLMTDGTGSASYSYSASSGEFTTVTNAPSGTSTQVTDVSGKVIRVTDAGGTLNYSYYSNGLEKSITHAGVTLVSMQYDQYGRQISLTDVDAGTIQYEHDVFGRLISQTDANGNQYVMSYDVMGREVSKDGPEGTYSRLYVTSGNGLNQIKSFVGANGVEFSYEYDVYGRMIKEQETIGPDDFTTQYEYDQTDNISSMIYPSGYQIFMQYDGRGNLIEVNDQNGIVMFKNPKLNSFGKYSEYALGNEIVTAFSYNNLGVLTGIKAEGVQELSYQFNGQTGNLDYRKDHLKDRQDLFTYDNANRLIEYRTGLISSPLVITVPIDIEYANNGNITEKTDIGVYSYDPNKIHAVVGVDNGGGVVPASSQSISYTPFDRVENVNEGTYSLDFTYNPDWNRAKTELFNSGSIEETRFYVGPYEKIVNSSGVQEVHYIPTGGGSHAVYLLNNGAPSYHYLYKDYLGSVLAVTDESGNIEFEQNFDAWGKERNPANWSYSVPTVPSNFTWVRGYTGHEHLREFTLINMNNRLYDPLICRMLSPDNFVQENYFSQNYNRYSYGFNNPLTYSDPDGEIAVAPVIAIAAFLIFTKPGYEIQKIFSPVAFHVGIHFGTHQKGIGFDVSVGIPKISPVSFRKHYGQTRYWSTLSGKSGVEKRKGGEFAISSYIFGVPLALTYSGTTFSGLGYDDEQTTHMISFGNPAFNGYYENDTQLELWGAFSWIVPEGDAFSDQFRTAAAGFTLFGFINVGMVIHTGDWTTYNGGGSGTKDDPNVFGGGGANDPEQRHGILYVGVGPLRMGADTESIRHAFQNVFAHDWLNGGKYGSSYPYFKTLDKQTRPNRFYFQFSTGSGNTGY